MSFVLGHIYLCGVREAARIEMVCQESCHCATKHSLSSVCQTNISLLSKHCQTSDQCTHDGLSKSSRKWPHLLMSGLPRQKLLSDIKMLALKILIKVFF